MTRSCLRKLAAAGLLAAAFLGTFGAAAPARAEDPLPPSPQRWATDGAGFLSPGARQALDSRLEAYERSSGHQFLVWIGASSGNRTPEEFAQKAFAAWRVGRKGLDDGLVLFVFAQDRKLRFEVGYGLESKLTDAVAGRILREAIVPKLQAGDADGAINAGVEAAIATLSGTSDGAADSQPGTGSAADEQAPPAPSLSLGEKIVIGLLVLGFIILLITHPSLALYLLVNVLTSGGGGRSGGGGGGWSGGGGSSGGGGASGSW